VLAGIYQGVLLVLAIIVRIAAPGRPAPLPFGRKKVTAAAA
jgi:hypothetical protein